MKNKNKKILSVLIVMLMAMTFITPIQSEAKVKPKVKTKKFVTKVTKLPTSVILKTQYNIEPNKTWTINFNGIIKPIPTNFSNIVSVVDSKNNKVTVGCKLSTTKKGSSIIINSPDEGYKCNETYTLKVSSYIYIKNSKIKQSYALKFVIRDKTQEEKDEEQQELEKQKQQELERQRQQQELEKQKQQEELEKEKKIVESRISFVDDITLFTLYAFMNYTGYNIEQGDSPTYVRQHVMEDLKNMNLQLSDNNYFKERIHDEVMDDAPFCGFLNSIKPAPSFDYVSNMSTPGMSDLPEKLREFYVKANIPELYKKYKPYYDEELNKYKSSIPMLIIDTHHFLKIDINNCLTFKMRVNLLQSHYRHSGLGYFSRYDNSQYITMGPSYLSTGEISVPVHEYMHGIINPIIDKCSNEVALCENKKSLIPSGSIADLYYSRISWNKLIKDMAIRAIEIRINEMYDPNLNVQGCLDYNLNTGFVGIKYFYNYFDKYKDYKGTLEDFIRQMLIDYSKVNDQ